MRGEGGRERARGTSAELGRQFGERQHPPPLSALQISPTTDTTAFHTHPHPHPHSPDAATAVAATARRDGARSSAGDGSAAPRCAVARGAAAGTGAGVAGASRREATCRRIAGVWGGGGGEGGENKACVETRSRSRCVDEAHSSFRFFSIAEATYNTRAPLRARAALRWTPLSLHDTNPCCAHDQRSALWRPAARCAAPPPPPPPCPCPTPFPRPLCRLRHSGAGRGTIKRGK